MANYATRYYPELSKGDLRFVLVEASPRILPEVGEDLGKYTVEELRKRRIEVRLNTRLESCVGGHIVLSAETVADGVRFCVSDTGPGIEAQDMPHIFDRFWQVRRVRRGGVGLGLAIGKGIVEAHGGRIWVHSKPGVGSEFFFTIPAAAGI